MFPKGYAGAGGIGERLRFGVIMGLLWVLPHGVVLHGVEYGATGKLILVDAAWHLVEQGIGGIVMALTLWVGVRGGSERRNGSAGIDVAADRISLSLDTVAVL